MNIVERLTFVIPSIAGNSGDEDVDISTVFSSSSIRSHRLTLNEWIDGLNDRVDVVEQLSDFVSGNSNCFTKERDGGEGRCQRS